MTKRKKTDGERIAEKTARSPHEKWGMIFAANLAAEIDRLVRRRMAEAWEDGWFDRDCQELDWNDNPYRRGLKS